MLECAKVVLDVTGSESQIRFEPLPQDDPKQRRPDITKARTLLGWEPKIDLHLRIAVVARVFSGGGAWQVRRRLPSNHAAECRGIP